MPARAKLLVASGALGAPLFLILMFTLGALEPGYSHLKRAMSVLGGVPGIRGVIFNAGVGSTGVLVVIFSYALHRRLPASVSARIAFALLALGGLGLIGAGVFHCNPGCRNILAQPDLTGRIHIVASFVAGAGAGMALFFYAWAMRKSRSLAGLAAPTLVAAILANGPGVLYWFGFATGERVASLSGLMERLGLVVTLLWMFYVALVINRRDARARGRGREA